MGKATITDNKGNGLYQIAIDLGTAERDAELNSIATRIVELDALTITATADVASASAENDAAVVILNQAIDAYNANPQLGVSDVTAATEATGKANEELIVANIHLTELTNERDILLQRKVVLEGLNLQSSQEAWCADYTGDASGEVATIEIPGENNKVLILPGARGAAPADGYLLKRGVQDPNQAYYNAAILPGWQKFKPNYRLGEIVTIHDDETCDVLLDDMRSSAQNLKINQAGTLLNVPIEYMSCSRAAFHETDRVVVRFNSQAWSDPVVVGFESNPTTCTGVVLKPRDNTGYPVGQVLYIEGDPGDAPTYAPYSVFADSQKLMSNFENSTTEDRVSTSATWNFAGNYWDLVIRYRGSVIFNKASTNPTNVVFMTTVKRVILIEATGEVWSFGANLSAGYPYDAVNQPDGWLQLGTIMPGVYFVQPDGEEFYTFGVDNHERYSVPADGLSLSLDETVTYSDWTGPGNTGTLSNVIGVFWTGSAGSWARKFVTATSVRTFVYTGTLYDDDWETTIVADGLYSGVTFQSHFVETRGSGSNYTIQSNDSYQAVVPKFFGRSNYYQETFELSGTMNRTITVTDGTPAATAYAMNSTIKSTVGYLNGSAINTPETQTLSSKGIIPGSSIVFYDVRESDVWEVDDPGVYGPRMYGEATYFDKVYTSRLSSDLVASQNGGFVTYLNFEPIGQTAYFVEYNRGLIFSQFFHSKGIWMPEDFDRDPREAYYWGPWSSEQGWLTNLFGLDGQKTDHWFNPQYGLALV